MISFVDTIFLGTILNYVLIFIVLMTIIKYINFVYLILTIPTLFVKIRH